MVIHGQIEKAERREMIDKKTGQVGHLTQLVISDKTKPAKFRASTFFVTYLGDEKVAETFGTGVDLTDERVTLLVSEMSPNNAMIKTKGQVIKGWLSIEDLQRAATASEAPPGAPQSVERPVKPAPKA